MSLRARAASGRLLLVGALLLAGHATASEVDAPDPELLAFLAEFTDEQGELIEPALLEHLSRETAESAPAERERANSRLHEDRRSGRDTPPPRARPRAAGKEPNDAHE